MAVVRIDSVEVAPYEDGAEFGDTGPYEVVRAVLRYAVDPTTDASRRIVDLDRASPDANGLVAFESDLIVLRPADPGAGNRGLLYSVANRGSVPALPLSVGAFAIPGLSDRIEPGDAIMGFVTRGRGISVHRTDCANAAGLVDHAERLIEVEWDNDQQGTFVVSVEVEALDRYRLLRDISQVLAEYHVNIMSCTSQTSSDRVAKFRFDFELADPSHLDTILSALKRVDSVYAAYRVLPGHAKAGV